MVVEAFNFLHDCTLYNFKLREGSFDAVVTTVTDPGPAAAGAGGGTAGVGGTAGGRPSPPAAARRASPPPCARHTAPGSPDTRGVTTSPGYIRTVNEPSRSFTVPG